MAGLRRNQILLPALTGVLLVVAAIIGVAIWRTRTSGEGAAPPAPVAASPDPDAEARAAVLAAYDGYIRASVEANRRGDPSYGGLTMYAGDLLLLQVQEGIRQHAANDRYYIGDLKAEAKVDSIDLGATPPLAHILACIDATRYQLVYRKDNSPVPGANAGRRYMAAATATMKPDGRWLITAAVANTEQPC